MCEECNGKVYICRACAKERGCTWPLDHIGSFHIGTCNYCQEKKDVSSTFDWKWPTVEQKYYRLKYEEIFGLDL